MKTTLLVVVLLSACSFSNRPKDNDREGIADYIVASLNSGNVEEIDKYVVDKKQYRVATTECARASLKKVPGWDRLCDPQRNRAQVLAALRGVHSRLGECVRVKNSDVYNPRPEAPFLEVAYTCGDDMGEETFLLNKYVELDEGNWVATDYWVLDTYELFSGITVTD